MKNNSQIDICNLALGKIGAQIINSLDDESIEAQAIKRIYSMCLADELRKYQWSFAIKRVNLAAQTEPPLDYRYVYQLPSDFIRSIQVGKSSRIGGMYDYINALQAEYLIEGGKIYTDFNPPLFMRYISYVEDSTLFDDCFVNILALRLAKELVVISTSNSGNKASLQQDYQLALREAIRANAIEKAPVTLNDGSWMMARMR